MNQQIEIIILISTLLCRSLIYMLAKLVINQSLDHYFNSPNTISNLIAIPIILISY